MLHPTPTVCPPSACLAHTHPPTHPPTHTHTSIEAVHPHFHQYHCLSASSPARRRPWPRSRSCKQQPSSTSTSTSTSSSASSQPRKRQQQQQACWWRVPPDPAWPARLHHGWGLAVVPRQHPCSIVSQQVSAPPPPAAAPMMTNRSLATAQALLMAAPPLQPRYDDMMPTIRTGLPECSHYPGWRGHGRGPGVSGCSCSHLPFVRHGHGHGVSLPGSSYSRLAHRYSLPPFMQSGRGRGVPLPGAAARSLAEGEPKPTRR